MKIRNQEHFDSALEHAVTTGLIYHGQHDNGGDGSFPTLAVTLSPVNGWSIHT